MLFRLVGLGLLVLLLGVAVVKRDKISENLQLFWATQQAEQAEASGDLQEAEEKLILAHKQFPKHSQFTLMLGELYQSMRQPQRAQDVYKASLDDIADQLPVRLAYGQLLLQQGQAMANAPGLSTNYYNQAMAQFWEGLKTHSSNPELLGGMGQILQIASENPRENRVKIQRWLDRWASYYYRLALRNPIKDKPSLSLGLHYNLGVVSQRLQQHELAAKHFCQALVLAPSRSDTHFNLGLSLVDGGLVELGYRHLNSSISLLAEQHPDNIELARRLAERVQQIKNEYYNRNHANQSTITAQTVDASNKPAWLQSDCLLSQ
jgi:Tfp pilus assembly protein PilF